MQIPLLSGCFFTSDDRAGRPKTIISRRLAAEYFSGEDPLGRHLRLAAEEIGDYEVVGVVADTLHQVRLPARATMYFPVLNGGNYMGLTLVVRMASDPLAVSIPIQKQIAEFNPELPVTDVLTIEQIIERSLGNASLSAPASCSASQYSP